MKRFSNQTVFVVAFIKQFSPYSSSVIKTCNEIVGGEEYTFPCGRLPQPAPALH